MLFLPCLPSFGGFVSSRNAQLVGLKFLIFRVPALLVAAEAGEELVLLQVHVLFLPALEPLWGSRAFRGITG